MHSKNGGIMKNLHPLVALSKDYLQEKSLSSVTIKTYNIVFKHYIIYLTKHDILYAKTSDVIDYRESKRSLGYSSSWIHIQISALKGLYRYLRLHQDRLGISEMYAYDIMEPIKNERIKRRVKKPILSILEAKQMILHTLDNRKYVWDYRDHAIVYLMLTSGLSIVEIVRAKREDYQVVNGLQRLFVQGKKNTSHVVHVSSGAKAAVDDYLRVRLDDNPYLFVAHKQSSPNKALSRTFFSQMFLRVLRVCGLCGKGITPHCLRHTAATLNLQRGGSLEQTRALLRHVNIQSTQVYKDYLDRLHDETEAQIDAFLFQEESELMP